MRVAERDGKRAMPFECFASMRRPSEFDARARRGGGAGGRDGLARASDARKMPRVRLDVDRARRVMPRRAARTCPCSEGALVRPDAPARRARRLRVPLRAAGVHDGGALACDRNIERGLQCVSES